MMSKRPKKTKPKKAIDRAIDQKVDSSLELIQLRNRVDGLTELIASLSGQTQQLKDQVNNNWTRFVFHDHRRVDLSGPQFFNEDYANEFARQQKAQADAQARARGEQEPPKPAAPTDSPPSEK